MNDIRLSENFTISDLSVTQAGDLREANTTASYEYLPALQALCEFILEPLNLIVPGGINITSAYRCGPLNARLGATLSSQHLLGEAADVVSQRLSARQVFALARASDIAYGQLILENGWVHISLGAPFRAAEKCGESFVLLEGVVSEYNKK